MILPTVHLNGSNPESLFADNMNALVAVRVAIRMVQSAAPNARDYYVQGPAAIHDAMRYHEMRLKALGAVKNELENIVESIRLQIDERKARKAGR